MSAPFVSIVIPTYARPRQLRACLQSLLSIEYPRESFEVIVVDDGSPTSLDAIVAPFVDRLSLRLVRQQNAGPASARNRGAAIARGEYLLFTDDDCAPTSDWIDEFVRRFERYPDALVGGRVENQLADDLYASASQSLVSYLYGYFNRDPDRATFFTSNNFGMRRRLFHEAGGFDTTYPRAAAEDREFCDRWFSQGRRMVYAPAAKILHAHHMTLTKFVRQHWQYGCGAYRFQVARASRKAQPVKVEPLTFYTNLLRHPFTDPAARRPATLSALLFVTQAVNALGFFWQRFHDRRRPPAPRAGGASFVSPFASSE